MAPRPSDLRLPSPSGREYAPLLTSTSLAASLALAAAAGCASPPAPSKRAQEPQVSPQEAALPSFASPARWQYHPAAPETAGSWIRLSDGTCVITADGGQRWSVSPARGAASTGSTAAQKPCTGRAQAASTLAPEELTGIVRRPSGSWVFIGVSGALYEAATPLAPFTRTILPPEPLAKVAGAGSALLAATTSGKLLRWTDASRWQDAAGATTPARVVDVAVAEGGRALALSLPEALFATEDGGQTWTPSPLGTVGAARAGMTQGGELAVQGLTESITWDPRRTPAFSKSSEPIADAGLDIDVSVSPAPSAAAVLYGRAIIDVDRYYEIDHADDEGEGFSLTRGRLDGLLETRPMPGTTDCGSMKLGGSGKQVVTVCVRAMGDVIAARVRRSEDAGTTWSEPLMLETLDTDSVNIAVAPDGSALIVGVCKPAEGGAACKPGAPLLVRPEGKAMMTVGPTEALGLEGPALLPAFSADGRSAYFLGRRSKDERLALFVSHDGGETFTQRPLEQGETGRARPRAGEGDEESDGRGADGDGDGERGNSRAGESESYDVNEESVLSAGEDGIVGVSLVGDSGLAYITADEDGRVLRVAGPPVNDALIAGYGQRLVALLFADAGAPGDEAVRVWESLDGGATWSDIPGTRPLARDFFRTSPVATCGRGGCLFGDTVARVGWAGQTETRADAIPPESPTSVPALRTPIVCELSPTSRWTRIDGIFGSGGPDRNEAMRGRSVWSVLTYNKQTGEAAVVAAMLPQEGSGPARVVTRPLFGRAPNLAQTAIDLSHQMEGYAAARVRFQVDGKGEVKLGAPMRGVEVAWENFLDGSAGRATIPDAGPFELGDIKTNRMTAFDASFLSVSLHGIFVRPHSPSARSQTTFFLSPGGKPQRFDYPEWPSRGFGRPLSLRSDVVLADGQFLAVGMEPRGDGQAFTTLVLARGQGTSWAMTAATVAPRTVEERGLITQTDWTYSGKSIGVTALVTDVKRHRAWATFQAFRGDGTLGPAVPLPTPFDLGDAPRACTDQERAQTARLEAPMFSRGEPLFAGTRRPVIVTDLAPPSGKGSDATSGQIVLLTSAAVLHGTPSSPCVAGWDAFGAGSTVTAIVPGDLSQAWLFRPEAIDGLQGGGSSGGGVRERATEVRPMTCRLDPSAKIPDVAWNAPGAFRIER